MRRALLILMKIAVVLGLIVIGFELAIASYPPLAGAVVWLAASKGSQCNLLETISTVAFEQERAKAMRPFAKEIAEGRVTVVQAGAWDRESVLELDDDSLVLDRGTTKQHLGDDVVAIPQTVRAIVPDYEVICGRCTRKDNRLLANVLWFK